MLLPHKVQRKKTQTHKKSQQTKTKNQNNKHTKENCYNQLGNAARAFSRSPMPRETDVSG